MFDIAWPELALIAAVALVVIGPKDLPKVLMTLGQWTRKARMLAREFQTGIDDMVREAELSELRKQAEALHAKATPAAMEQLIDPTGSIAGAFAPPIPPVPEPAPAGDARVIDAPAIDAPTVNAPTVNAEGAPLPPPGQDLPLERPAAALATPIEFGTDETVPAPAVAVQKAVATKHLAADPAEHQG
ncbi:MAG: Sec-independent protein translocase protein TatB [Azospirillaceae bacterium]|nr:Sec-independent protein translocase protein TatB [Azospirillaceae bacterium]